MNTGEKWCNDVSIKTLGPLSDPESRGSVIVGVTQALLSSYTDRLAQFKNCWTCPIRQIQDFVIIRLSAQAKENTVWMRYHQQGAQKKQTAQCTGKKKKKTCISFSHGNLSTLFISLGGSGPLGDTRRSRFYNNPLFFFSNYYFPDVIVRVQRNAHLLFPPKKTCFYCKSITRLQRSELHCFLFSLTVLDSHKGSEQGWGTLPSWYYLVLEPNAYSWDSNGRWKYKKFSPWRLLLY